jgi:hypothetical protein
MLQNQLNEDKSRLRDCCQLTMDRIIHARQRAFATDKPCLTAQSITEKIAELSKRLADPTDGTARDDALVFLSFRYTSLSKQAVSQLKTGLQHYDERVRMLEKVPPDTVTRPFNEAAQPVKKNIVSIVDRFSELLDIKPGEEPLWYKIYVHTEVDNYAQVR